MRSFATWTAISVIASISLGCVSQHERDQLLHQYRQSQDQIIDLQAQLEDAEAQIAALRDGADMDADARARLERLREERDELEAALADAEEQLRRAGAGTEVALPEEIDHELEQLAASNPELMEYDAERGMIRFQSDLTFDLGSAEVRAGARESLQRLASILQSSEAAPYEVQVVGHTDNVPIGNPATRRQHPTNRHLSVHRSISVKNVLAEAGVEPARMQTAGYSKYRPIVENRADGAEENRRVEIYLVAMGSDARDQVDRAEGQGGGGGGGGQDPAQFK